MLDQFTFCPNCQHRLDHQGNKVVCAKCGFDQYDNPVPTTGMVFYNDNHILLVERGHEPAKGKWDVPGGFVDVNESAEEAMCREIKEELGLALSPTEIEYLGSFQDIYAEKGTQCVWSVFAHELNKSTELHPHDDAASVKWFAIDNLPLNLAFDGVRWSIELFKKKHSQ
ncbi:MAG TPA: NUDIX domain-containing protein [Patescibacteria group bacterium]